MSKGKVWLVGAGPGDASLISVKGLRCIRHADVIVHDRLVNPVLLQQSPARCRIFNVGKNPDHHPVPQAQINAMLVKYAREGLQVVRLKGGDPYVFGRGGEEGERLAKEGLIFEVVPGISSAIGGLACAGIPATHRRYASSLHIVTGHLSEGNDPQNWHALAQVGGTLVILMGMSRLIDICRQLMAGGMPAGTPAAVVMYASQPRQQIAKGTLADIHQQVARQKLHAPALIVIGEVVNLQEVLAFSATCIDIGQEPV